MLSKVTRSILMFSVVLGSLQTYAANSSDDTFYNTHKVLCALDPHVPKVEGLNLVSDVFLNNAEQAPSAAVLKLINQQLKEQNIVQDDMPYEALRLLMEKYLEIDVQVYRSAATSITYTRVMTSSLRIKESSLIATDSGGIIARTDSGGVSIYRPDGAYYVCSDVLVR